jgi:hypothetical protein
MPSDQKRGMTKLTALLTGLVLFYLAFWILTVNHHSKHYEETTDSFPDGTRKKQGYRDFVRRSKDDYSKIVAQQNRLHPLAANRRAPSRIKQEDQMRRMEFLDATHGNSTTMLNARAQRRIYKNEPKRQVTEEETPEGQN